MMEVRKQNEAAIKERLLVARKAGELSKDINVDDYTRYLYIIARRPLHPGSKRSSKAELKRTAQTHSNIWVT